MASWQRQENRQELVNMDISPKLGNAKKIKFSSEPQTSPKSPSLCLATRLAALEQHVAGWNSAIEELEAMSPSKNTESYEITQVLYTRKLDFF